MPQESPPSPFADDELKRNLRERTIRGTAMTAAAQIFNQVLNLLALAVLGRVLSPDDFGLIAMVTALTGFAEVFRDLGLSQAVVQKRNLTEEQVSTLFWLNAAFGGVITLALVASSPLIADFYADERLGLVTAVLSLSFLVSGVGVQHQALLKRQMRFQRIATISVVSNLAGHVGALSGALMGLSYWALVLSALISPVVSNLLFVVSTRWRPGFPRGAAGVRSLLSFGGYTLFFNLVNYAGRNADNIVIGKVAGADALGLYSKAYSLLMLPLRLINRPVSATAVPALARLQSEPERFAQFYYRGVGLVALLSMPVVTSSAAVADSVVLTVLGPRWLEAASLFKILSIPAFIGTTQIATGWVYLSLGNVRRQALSGVLNSALGVTFIVVGAQWGPSGVAWAIGLGAMLRRLPTLQFCFWQTPISLRGYVAATWRPALASIAAGLLTHQLHAQLQPLLPPLLCVLACAPPFLIAYFSLLWLLPGGRAMLHTLRAAAKVLLERKRS